MCEELHGSLEFLSCSGEENNDEADDGGHIWIHEGFWEYWAGRRYVRVIYGMIWDIWDIWDIRVIWDEIVYMEYMG